MRQWQSFSLSLHQEKQRSASALNKKALSVPVAWWLGCRLCGYNVTGLILAGNLVAHCVSPHVGSQGNSPENQLWKNEEPAAETIDKIQPRGRADQQTTATESKSKPASRSPPLSSNDVSCLIVTVFHLCSFHLHAFIFAFIFTAAGGYLLQQ